MLPEPIEGATYRIDGKDMIYRGYAEAFGADVMGFFFDVVDSSVVFFTECPVDELGFDSLEWAEPAGEA